MTNLHAVRESEPCPREPRPGGEDASIVRRYRSVRGQTTGLARTITPEDAALQSQPCCSPAKWHLAHTTWFFETFLLEPHLPGWVTPDPAYRTLFNSYYNAVGRAFDRASRGLLSRPSFEAVLSYREAVDAGMHELLGTHHGAARDALLPTVEIGLHHEQQHQELMLSDLKHLFSCNPLAPAFAGTPLPRSGEAPAPANWIEHPGGVVTIGHDPDAGFAYDNESPRHEVLVRPFRLADRLVTNAEWRAFIEDDGYRRPELWLDAGWTHVNGEGLTAPLYWHREEDAWREFTLHGDAPLDPDRPVLHVGFYEAEAFARWSGARLPTEFEWESVAADRPVEGNLLPREPLVFHAEPASAPACGRPRQLFGDAWEWTRSDYAPFPGYRPPEGAIGEYNGKFMSGQYVLRGGCFATPESHVRATYRNFYGPESRWCFAGVRLASDG